MAADALAGLAATLGGGLTGTALLALAGASAVFAAAPGPGIAAIVSQAVTRGRGPAVLWAMGTTLGDMVYLLFAAYGLGWVAGTAGPAFAALRWAGAGYLVWLGVRSLRAAPPREPLAAPGAACGRKRFLLGGMCVSLGNPKVIAFYCGFLPAFVDLEHLTHAGVAAVALVVGATVLCVATAFAVLAARGGALLRRPRPWKIMNRTAGTVMIGAGVAVAAQ